MRHLDLCSGIGGFSLGLERAGFRTIGFCERDPFCGAVLAKHWPGVPCFDDLRTLTGDEVRAVCGNVDIITGGPPCQPASVAGKRKGVSDERWLWPAFLRVVSEVRPLWVLAENPPGIISLRPVGLRWILGELHAAGYETWCGLIGACHVGAPHQRLRVWIVARLADAANRQLSTTEREQKTQMETRPGIDGGEELADASGQRLEGRRTRPSGRGAEISMSAECRWPSRPGEWQRGWEAPRLCPNRKSMSDVGRVTAWFSEWMDRFTGVTNGDAVENWNPPRTQNRGENAQGIMRAVFSGDNAPSASRGRESSQQRPIERDDIVSKLSYEMALGKREGGESADMVFRLREAWQVSRDVRTPLLQTAALWRSLAGKEDRAWWALAIGLCAAERLRRQNREALRALGNSIVPAIAEAIGRAIRETEGDE